MTIITTINNEKLNNKIKEKFSLIYEEKEEKIFELLKNNKKINNILINENIIKKYSFEEFINNLLKINKKIKIFIIFENKINNNKIEFLINKKIFNYYFNDEILIEELIENIFNKNNKIINNNFYKIKEKLKYKNINKFKIFNIFKLNNNNKINLNNKENCKIICVCGPPCVGKTSYIINGANKNKSKRILLIDMDEENKNLFLYYKNKKENKNIKINLINILIKNNKNINNLFNELKNKFDLIILDNNLKNNFNINKKIFNNIDELLFLIEPNIFGINSSNKLLEKLILKYGVEKNKIKIIINKNNKYSIDKNILNNIYYDYEIIKTIKYNKKYFLL